MAREAPYAPPLMALVNDEIDRLHRSLGLHDTEFFCECGRIDCRERVTLSRDDFARLRAQSRVLLVAAHTHDTSGVPRVAMRAVATL